MLEKSQFTNLSYYMVDWCTNKMLHVKKKVGIAIKSEETSRYPVRNRYRIVEKFG